MKFSPNAHRRGFEASPNASNSAVTATVSLGDACVLHSVPNITTFSYFAPFLDAGKLHIKKSRKDFATGIDGVACTCCFLPPSTSGVGVRNATQSLRASTVSVMTSSRSPVYPSVPGIGIVCSMLKALALSRLHLALFCGLFHPTTSSHVSSLPLKYIYGTDRKKKNVR